MDPTASQDAVSLCAHCIVSASSRLISSSKLNVPVKGENFFSKRLSKNPREGSNLPSLGHMSMSEPITEV